MSEDNITIAILLSNENIPKDIFLSSIDEYFGLQVEDFKKSSFSVCVLSETSGWNPSKLNSATFVKSQWLFQTTFPPNQVFEFKIAICDNQSWKIIKSEDVNERLIETCNVSDGYAIVVHLEWNKPHTVSVESLLELYSMDESLIKSHYENQDISESFKNLETIAEDNNDEESLLDSLQGDFIKDDDKNTVNLSDTDDSLEPEKESTKKNNLDFPVINNEDDNLNEGQSIKKDEEKSLESNKNVNPEEGEQSENFQNHEVESLIDRENISEANIDLKEDQPTNSVMFSPRKSILVNKVQSILGVRSELDKLKLNRIHKKEPNDIEIVDDTSEKESFVSQNHTSTEMVNTNEQTDFDNNLSINLEIDDNLIENEEDLSNKYTAGIHNIKNSPKLEESENFELNSETSNNKDELKEICTNFISQTENNLNQENVNTDDDIKDHEIKTEESNDLLDQVDNDLTDSVKSLKEHNLSDDESNSSNNLIIKNREEVYEEKNESKENQTSDIETEIIRNKTEIDETSKQDNQDNNLLNHFENVEHSVSVELTKMTNNNSLQNFEETFDTVKLAEESYSVDLKLNPTINIHRESNLEANCEEKLTKNEVQFSDAKYFEIKTEFSENLLIPDAINASETNFINEEMENKLSKLEIIEIQSYQENEDALETLLLNQKVDSNLENSMNSNKYSDEKVEIDNTKNIEENEVSNINSISESSHVKTESIGTCISAEKVKIIEINTDNEHDILEDNNSEIPNFLNAVENLHEFNGSYASYLELCTNLEPDSESRLTVNEAENHLQNATVLNEYKHSENNLVTEVKMRPKLPKNPNEYFQTSENHDFKTDDSLIQVKIENNSLETYEEEDNISHINKDNLSDENTIPQIQNADFTNNESSEHLVDDAQSRVSEIVEKFETLGKKEETKHKIFLEKMSEPNRISGIVQKFEEFSNPKSDERQSITIDENCQRPEKEIDAKLELKVSCEISSNEKKKCDELTESSFNIIHLQEKEKQSVENKPLTLRVNDDYRYPDSVTPTKVEHNLSQLKEYDVPFMDDDVFFKDNLSKDENRLSINSHDKDTKNSLNTNVEILKQTPRASIETLKDSEIEKVKVSIDQTSPVRKRKGLMSLCGCVGNKKRS